MTIIAYEHADSPEITWAANGKSAKGWRKYVVIGTQDEGVALAEAMAISPLVIAVDAEVLLRHDGPVKPTGFDTWEVEFNYGPDDDEDKSQQKPQPGFWKFAFSTSGHKEKRFFAKKLIWKAEESPAYPAPDTLAINWDPIKKKIGGVEVPVSQFEFEIEAFYPAQKVTTAFAANLARNTPRTNKNKWLDFEPGELLYVGSDGAGDIPTVAGQRVKPVGIKHKYAASENLKASDIDLGKSFNSGQPLPGGKKGWEYLSTFTVPKEDASGVLVPNVVWAWVFQMFGETDFRALFGFG